jgi:pantetheine-phosphate adenylyltransferase
MGEMMSKRVAIFPGSFDPFTSGHDDLVKRALKMFDEVIITIAVNSTKTPLFSAAERKSMISEIYQTNTNVSVEYTDGLLVDFAKERNAIAIIRGLRAVSDFEYELQIALMNRHLAAEITTVFLMPHEKYTYLNSSIVKAVALHGGDVSDFLPANINSKLQEKFTKK